MSSISISTPAESGSASLALYQQPPVTLSDKAKEYFRTSTRPGIAPGIEPNWEGIRAGYRYLKTPASDTACSRYLSSTEKSEMGGVPIITATPQNYTPSDPEKILIYVHGGAFTLGSADHLYHTFAAVTSRANLLTIAVEYGLAPENPFPGAIHQVLSVYRELQSRYHSQNIVFLGDSAGGNLVLASLIMARDEGVPLPKAVALYSPVVDAEKGRSDSWLALRDADPGLAPYETFEPSLNAYCPDASDKKNRLISVINNDFHGFCPVMIHSGTRDQLLSDSVRLWQKLTRDGVEAHFVPFEGGWHGMHETECPESEELAKITADFFLKQFGKGA